MPMLDEQEWDILRPLLELSIKEHKAYYPTKHADSVSLAEARDKIYGKTFATYRAITGQELTDVDAVWHHRISLLGPQCGNCGKRLRTPMASRCVECGTTP